jgi:hypothetical protein
MSQFMRGVPFERLERQADEYLELLDRFGLREPRSAILAVRKTIDALKNPESRRAGNAEHAPRATEPEPEFGSRHIAHYAVLAKLQEQYLFCAYDAALETAKRSAQYLSDSRGMLHGAEHPFYLSLVRMALAREQAASRRRAALPGLQRTLRKFEHWAQNSPVNFSARALVLRGEYDSLAGKPDAAPAAFADAARTAIDYHQPHLAALAERLAAAEFARRGQPQQQKQHIARAAEFYRRWGAHGFAAHLEELPDNHLVPRSISA